MQRTEQTVKSLEYTPYCTTVIKWITGHLLQNKLPLYDSQTGLSVCNIAITVWLVVKNACFTLSMCHRFN